MYWMIFIALFLLLFSSILLTFNLFLSKKSFLNREKNSPFECGFDPLINSRLPFSMHFFLISLIFLIFDIEIALLIPLILIYLNFNKFLIFSCFLFLIILLMGFYYEYYDNSFDWKI